MNANTFPYAVIDQQDIPWKAHPRHPSVFFKPLLSKEQHPQASVGLVRFPPGSVINIHSHPHEIETIYCLEGKGVFTLDGQTFTFSPGQIVVVPAEVEHGLRNDDGEDLLIITFFTPPLF